MAVLDVYMNGYLVGEFTKSTTGSHLFKYAEQWLDTASSRPISLSMQLPKDFPEYIRNSILDGLANRAKRITVESVWEAC